VRPPGCRLIVPAAAYCDEHAAVKQASNCARREQRRKDGECDHCGSPAHGASRCGRHPAQMRAAYAEKVGRPVRPYRRRKDGN